MSRRNSKATRLEGSIEKDHEEDDRSDEEDEDDVPEPIDNNMELKELLSDAIKLEKIVAMEKKEDAEIESDEISSELLETKLNVFINSQMGYAEMFDGGDEQAERVYDSLFYPHHVRSTVLQQKRKKKKGNSINALSTPVGLQSLSIIGDGTNDDHFTLFHLYYIIALLKERQKIQLKQYMADPKVTTTVVPLEKDRGYPVFSDNKIQLHYDDFGVSIDTICYCLESNRYVETSEEGKKVKALSKLFGPCFVSKKKLISFLSLYPNLFQIISPRKQVDIITLKYMCYNVGPESQIQEILDIRVEKDCVEIVDKSSNEILNSSKFQDLPERKTLDINNEEHVKLVLRILSGQKNRSSFKLTFLRRTLFDKYDFNPSNLIPFLKCFPQHFSVNPKSTKQKVRRVSNGDVFDFAPRIEEVLFDTSLLEKKSSQPSETPSVTYFELPTENYTVVSTTNEQEVDKWIQEHVFTPIETGQMETVVVGMDTEFDLFKLNKSYQTNPALHEKLWKLFRKQQDVRKDPATNRTTIYDSQEYEALKYQYFKEYEQTILPDLIQLSTENSCLLYGTCEGRSKPSNLFVKLMFEKNVLKTWCSYHEDVKLIKMWISKFADQFNHLDLFKDFGALIELDGSQKGASSLCEQLLGLKMAKERAVQVSRWSRTDLSGIQRKYAAQDAYLNCLLYSKMQQTGRDLSQVEDQEDISFSLFDPIISEQL